MVIYKNRAYSLFLWIYFCINKMSKNDNESIILYSLAINGSINNIRNGYFLDSKNVIINKAINIGIVIWSLNRINVEI